MIRINSQVYRDNFIKPQLTFNKINGGSSPENNFTNPYAANIATWNSENWALG